MDVDPEAVTRRHRDNEAVQRLLTHERNKRVKDLSGAYFYRRQDDSGREYRSLSGLLPRLKTTFWPNCDMRAILKKPKRLPQSAAAGRQKKKKKPKEKPLGKRRHGRFFGLIRGTETHREIQDFIQLDARQFRKRHPVIQAFTKSLLLFLLERMKWEPVAAEFVVFDEHLGLATALDMICLERASGKLIFLEFKTGYSAYFDNSSGYMHHSLAQLVDSPHNQANIQLLTAVMLVMLHHRLRVDQFDMYVIRVDEHGPVPHKLNNAFLLEHGRRIYGDLYTTRQENRV